jgi:Hint domain
MRMGRMTSYTWKSAVSGDWGTSADWSTAGGPVNFDYDTAVLGATGADYTVSFGGETFSIGTIQIETADLTLAVNGGTLSAGELVAVAGSTIDVDSGAFFPVVSSGALDGVLNVNGGTVALNGVALAATSTIDLTGGGVLAFTGDMTAPAGSLIEVTGGSGTISASNQLSGGGTVLAQGGTLDLDVPAGGVTVAIGASAGSAVDVSGPVYYGTTLTAVFEGSGGALVYSNVGNNSGITYAIQGLNVSGSDSVDLSQAGGLTVVSGGIGSGSSGTVVLSNGDTLALSGIAGASAAGWKMMAAPDGGSGTAFSLSPVCFVGGTRILTETGEVAVEDLRPGDRVVTLVERRQVVEVVRWIGERRLDLTAHPRASAAAPIRICRGAVRRDVPNRDFLVSPDHAVLLDGVLICARLLVNGMTIRQELGWTSVRYFHVELDRHAILLAEGMAAESYLDTGNRGFFANGGAPLVLHPDLMGEERRVAGSCAPLVSDEGSVQPVWERLADRALGLGYAASEGVSDADPGLRVVVGDLVLKPVSVAGGRHVFVLPALTEAARVVSRCGVPGEVRPWVEDRRVLGAYVERVTLRDGAEVLDIPLDHAALAEGWWALEVSGAGMRRWTNGDARLRVVPCGRPVVLEIRLAESSMRYRVAA